MVSVRPVDFDNEASTALLVDRRDLGVRLRHRFAVDLSLPLEMLAGGEATRPLLVRHVKHILVAIVVDFRLFSNSEREESFLIFLCKFDRVWSCYLVAHLIYRSV